MATNETRNIDLYESSERLLDVYPNYECLKLPSWVLNEVEAARVYGNKKRGVILPDGRKYHLDNKLNDMTGKIGHYLLIQSLQRIILLAELRGMHMR